jgi:phosphopantothenoylcysteine decarboxylase / phosphopantothenate---cysteine ligase
MAYPEKLLVGITGTVGTLTIPSYLQVLREKFSNIKIIMSETATKFITKEATSIIIDEVQSSLFPSSKGEMTHVQLARWADLFIVLPASANTIAKVAHGFGDNLLTLAILAHEHSVMFFPNMNKFMWEHPATQRNLSLIREYGHQFVSPIERVSYEHHSGDKNTGKHLPPPHEVIAALESEIEKRKALVEKALDRVVCNTGKMCT